MHACGCGPGRGEDGAGENRARVGIIMGSDSDLATMKAAAQVPCPLGPVLLAWQCLPRDAGLVDGNGSGLEQEETPAYHAPAEGRL